MLLPNSSERNKGHIKQKKGEEGDDESRVTICQNAGLANYSQALTGASPSEVTISNN